MNRLLPVWARWALSLVLLAVAIGAASARVGLLQQAGGVELSAEWALTDFYSAAYNPIRTVLEGETPYARDSTYPPYAPLHLLIHFPFALLPPKAAGVAYFLFTSLLTIPLAYLALRLASLRPQGHRVLLVAAALLLSRPGHWTLLLGQVSILLTVATYLGLVAARAGSRWSMVALAVTLLKPTFGLPLALLLLAWNQGRTVILGLGLAVLVNLPFVALFAVREGGIAQLSSAVVGGYRSWQEIPDVNPATSSTRTDVVSLISRFLGEPVSDQGQVLLSLGILVISAAALRLLARHQSREAGELAVAIICLAMSLVGFHRGYDLVLLAAPFLAALGHGIPGAPPGTRLMLVSLFVVPALNWLATESVLTAWQPSHPVWLLITSVNSLCLVVLLLAYLWLTLRYHNRAVASDDARDGADAGPVSWATQLRSPRLLTCERSQHPT